MSMSESEIDEAPLNYSTTLLHYYTNCYSMALPVALYYHSTSLLIDCTFILFMVLHYITSAPHHYPTLPYPTPLQTHYSTTTTLLHSPGHLEDPAHLVLVIRVEPEIIITLIG